MSSQTRHNSWYIKSKIWRDLNDVLTESQSLRANSDLIFNSTSDSSLWFNLYVSIYYDINNYNVTMIMKWMTNMNLSLCMNQTTMMHYLIKYCFKIKKKSEAFKSLLQFVMLKVSDRTFLLFLAIKLMNKSIVERNWSAQEMCHHLLQRNLWNFSWVVQNLDLRSIKKQ